jgi:2-polyprenyl-3-methyl-5-hydroxy-6-metoxy-1,4-benzoquinol methylase
VSLFETETKLRGFRYSKCYYERAKPEVLSAIPEGVRSVLSIGCGWGSTESHLAEKGLRVSAVPLDPVIPGGAEAGGVEIINGDLASARRGLADRKFDCLLLSNVLHLVPNPRETLSSYGSLLSDGGTVIAVTPNMARLAATWKSLRGDSSSAARGRYERTGVHRVSRRVLRDWFRSAGMKIEKIVPLHRKSITRTRRIASRLLGSWMADEFVVVAGKN